jgi:putative spermidine/putrescine transport system substrate-binding protein
MPNIGWAQSSTIIVRVYQGHFRTVFDQTILPKFTSLTGIAVKTMADTTSAAWLIELEKAARVGVAAADVSMMSRVATDQGMSTKLWAPIDLSRVPYSRYLMPQYVKKYGDGSVAAVGASTWTVAHDTAYWGVSRASRATAQNQAFIDYMCRPTVQTQLIDALGLDPTVVI